MPRKRRAAHHFSEEYSSDNMEISIKHELIVFWGAFFCSQVICILFDFFRALRKSTHPGRRLVALQDIVFCALSFKIFFDTCYVTNNGKLRWYIFVSFFLSMVLYFCIESAFVIKIWLFLLKLTGKLITPFVKLVSLLKPPVIRGLKALKASVFSFLKSKKDKLTHLALQKLRKKHEINT